MENKRDNTVFLKKYNNELLINATLAPSDKYVMETPLENHRLSFQTDAEKYATDFLIPHLDLSELHLLDVGCGTATILSELAKHAEKAHLIGIDSSSDRVKAARLETAEIPNITIRQCDARQLAKIFKRQFNALHSRFVLDYFSDEEKIALLQQFRHVLLPGGTVILQSVDTSLGNHYPEDKRLDAIKSELKKTLCSMGYDDHAGRKLPNLLIRCGFRDVKVRTDPYNLFFGGVPDDKLKALELKLVNALPVFIKTFGKTQALSAVDYYLEYMNRADVLTFSNLFTVIAVK